MFYFDFIIFCIFTLNQKIITMGAVGRPPIFKNEKELQEKIDEYFDTKVTKDTPITITGLMLHLGFCSRQSLYDYEKNSEFSYTIKRARARVENHYENLLQNSTNGSGGIVFALKNFGWTDKQEIEHTGATIKTIVIQDASEGQD